MHLRPIAVVAAALVASSSLARPAQADPAVQGITIGAIPFVVWALFAEPPKTRDPDLLVGSAGWFDVVDGENEAAEARVEWRSGALWWKVRPQVGAAATSDGGAYGYAGLRIDAYFGRHLVVSPSFSAVAYFDGGGKDLGSAVVGRSGFDVAWRFDNDVRIGLAFHHMSHGGIFGDENPGTEVVSLTYAIPIHALFGR